MAHLLLYPVSDARTRAARRLAVKTIALVLLTMAVLGGLAATAEARGPGWMRGSGCGWRQAAATVPAQGYGPGSCPAWERGGAGRGQGYGPGWMMQQGWNAPQAQPAPQASGK